MAKEQTDAEREAEIAKNRKASGDAARKQLQVPAKKKDRADLNQAAPRTVREDTEKH